MSILVEVNGLSKRFGDKQALNNVSFQINKGEPVALVGPNGAGKTTLFSILCGYLPYDTGEVSVFGAKPASSQTFNKLAALPQDAQLDPAYSIEEQLKFYAQLQGFSRKQSLIESHRTLDLVGLNDNYKVKPLELSHGMRKRVSIAQALIGSPELIMLDEATAGLDPKHAKDVREIVSRLAGEITFVLSSHDLSELERLCDQVLYLENGVLRTHQTIDNTGEESYLTLRMKTQPDNFVEIIRNVAGVNSVSLIQGKEYLVSYNAQNQSQPLDIEILKLCHENNWSYTQLFNGKTLENQLF